MNRTKKMKILLLILVISIMVCLSGTVNAATVKMTLTSDSQLVAGDTVVVNLKISEINAGDGIDAIAGTLDYDKNVFEEVTEDSFEGKNKWNVGIYSTDTQMFTVLKSSKVNLPTDVLTITLRVKDSATVDSSTIQIKDITASGGAVADGGTGDIDVETAKVTISKKITPPPTTNETVNETVNETANEVVNETTNEVNGGNTNTNVNTNKVTTNTIKNESTGKLPQTGEDDIAIIIGISIIAVISIVAFIKYRNLNI